MWADAYVYASYHLDEVERIRARPVVLSAGRVIADAKAEELTRTMYLKLLLCEKGPHVPKIGDRAERPATAQYGAGALFWARMLPIAFGLTSLAPWLTSPGRFWRHVRVGTEGRTA